MVGIFQILTNGLPFTLFLRLKYYFILDIVFQNSHFR